MGSLVCRLTYFHTELSSMLDLERQLIYNMWSLCHSELQASPQFPEIVKYLINLKNPIISQGDWCIAMYLLVIWCCVISWVLLAQAEFKMDYWWNHGSVRLTYKGFEESYASKTRGRGTVLLETSFLSSAQISAVLEVTGAIPFCSLKKEWWLPDGKWGT